jgi:hypothetical protein
MVLSDVLGTVVRAADGRVLGLVRDVRLIQDGPIDGTTARLRVDALVVSPHSLGLRLGYHHGGLRSPWLVRTAVRLLNRHVYTVAWTDVETFDVATSGITLRAEAKVG